MMPAIFDSLANFEFSAFNKKRIGYKDTSSNKLSKKLQKTAVFIKNSGFGRSAEARTLDLLLPNQARYHLRYTRIFSFRYYTTLGAKIKVFPVCGHSCGQGRLSAWFGAPAKSRKRPCFKAFRASVIAIVDSTDGTPKEMPFSQIWVRETP